MDEREDRERFGIQVRGTIEITVVGAVLLYVARKVFSAAYFLSLGLSPDFRLVPPDSAVWPVVAAVASLYIVFVGSRLVEEFGQTRAGGVVLAITCSLAAVALVAFSDEWMRTAWRVPVPVSRVLSVLLLGAAVYTFWVRPVFTRRGTCGYWRKVADAFRVPAAGQGPAAPVATSMFARAFRFGGTAARIPVFAIVAIGISGWLGHAVAASQRDWIEVDSGESIPSPGHRVVFAGSDGSLWTADLADDGTLSAGIRFLNPGERGCTLRPLHMKARAQVR